MRRRIAAATLLAALLAACSRGPAPPAEPASFDEAMKLASTRWERGRWSEVFAACDKAFAYADRAGESGVLLAADCVAEAALRMGKPELAIPHYERVFAAHEERLRTAGNRVRLANNYGVLLIERGRREEGIESLEWALQAWAGTTWSSSGRWSFPARAMVVRNLARAYYGKASDPAVRAWVHEQGTSLHEYMTRNAAAPHLSMGGTAALEALATIGKRQANTDTPAWDAMVAGREPVEAGIVATHPRLGVVCEAIPLRTTMLDTCMRELAPAGG
jgi:tetratricopeptide (TPR) repeat protein